MKKRIIFLALLFFCLVNFSCSMLEATFGNKNVYKTKSDLVIKKVYLGDAPSTDQRLYTLHPNDIASITKTVTTTFKQDAIKVGTTIKPEITITTKQITVIPAGESQIVVDTVKLAAPAAASTTKTTKTNKTTTYSVVPVSGSKFIRYKVVAEDDNFKYIKILSGCRYGTATNDTLIVLAANPLASGNAVGKDVFSVSTTLVNPNTSYLASSALIGKVITIPVKIRNQYWNNDNKILEGSLSLGYGFGWKCKLGNNPYRQHYFSVIPYAGGISQQKYFSILGTNPLTNAAVLSEKTDEIAITYLSFGVAYEYDKFTIGFFAGKDKMFGNLHDWAYQDRWWWGLGIGYEVFK